MNLEIAIKGFEESAHNIKSTIKSCKLGIVSEYLAECYCEDIEWYQRKKLGYLAISSSINQKRIINAQKIFEHYKFDLAQYLNVDLKYFDWEINSNEC